MALRFVYSIPLIGWMVRDAIEGPDESRLWALMNVGLLWIWSGILFGYPGILLPALVAAATMLVLLVVLTAGGLFQRE